MQQLEFVGSDCCAIAEQRNDNAQPDRRFGSRHRDRKKHDYLPIDGADPAAQSDKRQIDCIDHQFDRHEHDDDVAANQHADDPDGEQDTAEDHEIVDRGHCFEPNPQLRGNPARFFGQTSKVFSIDGRIKFTACNPPRPHTRSARGMLRGLLRALLGFP